MAVIKRVARVTGFDASVSEMVEWIKENLPRKGQLDDNEMSLNPANADDLVFIKRIERKEEQIAKATELLNVAEQGSAEYRELEREVIDYTAQLLSIKKTAFGVDRSTKNATYFTPSGFLASVATACEVINRNHQEWLNGEKVSIVGGSCNEELQTFGIKRYTPKQMGGKRSKTASMDQRLAALDKAIGYEESDSE